MKFPENLKYTKDHEWLRLEGDTDLAWGSRKCAGNAQRRLPHALLFHGCFLLHADLTWIERLLPLPSRAPAYRAGRAHRDFLVNLALPAEAVKAAVRAAWGATSDAVDWPRSRVAPLVREKYATEAWNLKF